MEKWKIFVIIFLLGGLAGLGAVQSRLSNGPDTPPADAQTPAGEQPRKEEPLPVMKMMGKSAPSWNIPQQYWINTKKPLDLKDFKGSMTLLEFFRIECSHCQDAVPFMKQLQKTYAPKGLKIVAIQAPGMAPTENDWQTVQDKLREWKVTYPVAFDEKAQVFQSKYNGTKYPTMLLLDPHGVVRFVQTGYTAEKAAQLESTIKMGLQMMSKAPSTRVRQ
jgi:thiol-disulfide isomerase/thioredoxin